MVVESMGRNELERKSVSVSSKNRRPRTRLGWAEAKEAEEKQELPGWEKRAALQN